jgi:hypothetical protein
LTVVLAILELTNIFRATDKGVSTKPHI